MSYYFKVRGGVLSPAETFSVMFQLSNKKSWSVMYYGTRGTTYSKKLIDFLVMKNFPNTLDSEWKAIKPRHIKEKGTKAFASEAGYYEVTEGNGALLVDLPTKE